jgi:putative hydrolase of the HAD superfamily
MGANGSLPLSNDRLTIFSEPGKHAFAPDPAWYRAGKKKNRWLCCRGAGTGGVLVSDLFADLIDIKSSQTDKLVQTFLREHAFVPSHEFNRSLRITSEQLVPWPQLFGWIPERVSQLVAGLRESARFTTGSLEPLACEELL